MSMERVSTKRWYIFATKTDMFGPDIGWMPSVIMFIGPNGAELRGLSVFSTREKAQQVVDTLSAPESSSIMELGVDCYMQDLQLRLLLFMFEPLSDRALDKMMNLKVYLDLPPGGHSEGLESPWTVSTFMTTQVKFETEYKAGPPIHYKSHTIIINESVKDKDFAAAVTRGIYQSRDAIVAVSKTGKLRPEDRHVTFTYPTYDQAVAEAKKYVDEKLGASLN